MALDPLKFKIAIERRELDKELKDAKETIANSLKDVPITLKIANLEAIKSELAKLEVKVGASGTSSHKEGLEELKKSADAASKLLAIQTKVTESLEKMTEVSKGATLVTGFEEAKRKLDEFKSRLDSVSGADATKAIIKEWTDLGSVIAKVIKEQEKANKADADLAAKYATSMGNAKKVLADIENLLGRLRNSQSKAGLLGISTEAIDKQIAELEKLQTKVKAIAEGTVKAVGFKATPDGDLTAQMKYAKEEMRKLDKEIKEKEKADERAAKAAEKHAAEMRRSAEAANQLSLEEQKLAKAIQQSISGMNQQSQVLNDLKSMAMQYLSVYAGQQFLNNIIEIGGQLEMQRLSIGAILQDTAHANDLFERIKGLALQSPFGVVELDQFTKQLSAYGFQYNELFDMTKRLADISAGAGTDVSRLALALGHVRAEGALTGYTLRQFAMNNIPMLGKLSEKLSELEGRIVTAGEVRKRVREKDIDYAMVESVIKDLTNEGGMFYNMQEVISGSVKAKWKNLRDAFDVMYGEMAESAVGGGLKDVATMLTTMAKKWKELGTVVLAVAGVYGGMKTVMLVYNTLLGQQTRAVFSTIAAQRQARVANLQLESSYRTLTSTERGYILTSTKVSLADKARMVFNTRSAAFIRERIALTKQARMNEISMALSTKQLTAAELARAVALGKVNKNAAILAIGNARLHEVQKQQMQATVASVRTYGMFTGVVNGAAMAFTKLGTALKGLLLNPTTWIFALIAGITDLWQRNNQEMERAAGLSKSLAERASEGLKNVRTMMAETGMAYEVNGVGKEFGSEPGGKITYASASSLDADAMIQIMEKWESFIKDYSSTPNTLLQNALFDDHKLRSLTEQYENLAKATESVMMAQQALAQIADMSEFVVNSTQTTDYWGLFDDDIITNMNDYAKAVRKADSVISNFAMSERAAMTAVLNTAKADKVFAAALENANATMQDKEGRNLTEVEQLKMLVASQDLYAETIRKAEQAISDIGSRSGMTAFSGVKRAANNENEQRGTLYEDAQKAADAVRQKVKEVGWDINNLADYQNQAIVQILSDMVAKSGDSTDAIKKKIMDLIATALPEIKVDINTVDAIVRISQVQEELNKLVDPKGDGSGWTINIKGAVDANGVVQKVREAYKKAKDTITNLGPIAIKMGLSLGGVKVMTPEQIDSASGGSVIKKMALTAINEAYKQIDQAEKASNTYGFSLVDSTKGGKVFKAGKEKSDKKGSKEDKEAKEWKERIRLLRDARSWYDKWEKEIGHTSALERVQEMFKGLITKKDIESLEAYKRALDAVIKKAEARRAKNGGNDQHAEEVIRQGKDVIQDIDLMIFQRNSEDFASAMDKEIDSLTRQWETFNNVLENTGDRFLALKMAGLIGRDSRERNSADSLRNNIAGMPGGDLINFSSVLKMSDKDIDKYVKNLLGGSDKYRSHIDAITKGLKEWRKLSENVMKQDIQNYARLIGSAKDYWSLIRKNNSEYDEVVKSLMANFAAGVIDEAGLGKGLAMATADRDDKNSKISANYINLINNANALNKGEMLDAIDNAVMHLNERMKAGTITTEEYVNELGKLDKIRQEWDANGFMGSKGAFGSFLAGGNNGLLNYYSSQYNKYNTAATEARQKYGEDSEEYKNAQGEADRFKKLRDGLQKVTDNADDLVAAFDSLQKGVDLVTKMFASLGGMKGDATAGEDFGGILGGALGGASALSGLGPWGMAAGAALGTITSIAELSDKRIERRLQDIKEEVQKVNNTLNLIHSFRERTLGYDNGSNRRAMAEKYNTEDIAGIYAEMHDFYSRGGLETSGYTQELAALKKQREQYIDMYWEEVHRKTSSDEALEEYKQKVAELDSVIENYAMDLANELWSIDLKGWADQIGDALMNAFENGTSAAEAFKDATKSILQSVVSEMLKLTVIEPMMKVLKERIGKVFNVDDPKSSMGAVLEVLGDFFGAGGEGQQMMTGASEFFQGANELFKKNFGIDLMNSSQTSQTSGIQSQATEESIGIVSGQMARIAQDVSVKRIFVTQIATEQMPKLLENAQMQRNLLETQFQSVRAIEHAIVDGDGALYASIDRMSRKIDRAITPEGRMRIE